MAYSFPSQAWANASPYQQQRHPPNQRWQNFGPENEWQRQLNQLMPSGGNQPQAGGLRDLQRKLLFPDIRRRQGERDQVMRSAINRIQGGVFTPGARQAAEASTAAFAQDLFGPQGAVSEAISGAVRGGVKSGFGVASGGVVAGQNRALEAGSREVARFGEQQLLQASGLELGSQQAELALAQGLDANAMAELQSGFISEATVQQLLLSLLGLNMQK